MLMSLQKIANKSTIDDAVGAVLGAPDVNAAATALDSARTAFATPDTSPNANALTRTNLAPAVSGAVDRYYSQQAKQQAYSRALNLLIGGAAFAGGARGLLGLWNERNKALETDKDRKKKTYSGSSTIEIPEKRAGSLADRVTGAIGSAASAATDSVTSFLRGDSAKEPSALPLEGLPLAFLGGGTGLYGGWKMVDHLMDRRRKQQRDEELEQAQREFEEALRGNTASTQLRKVAALSAPPPPAPVDPSNAFGRGAGALLTAMLATGLVSGGLAYDWTKRRQPGTVLNKARKRLLTQRQMLQPTPILAFPRIEEVPDEEETIPAKIKDS